MLDPETRFLQHYNHAIGKGLRETAARGYATLAYWSEHFGHSAAPITSGRRTQAQQANLISLARRGTPGIYTPAQNSKHLTGNAFDISASYPLLSWWGAWAPYVGLRWGGTFSKPDPVHFDTGGS